MEVGDVVWARDQNGEYFKAQSTHVHLFGDDALEYEVHFIGWSAMCGMSRCRTRRREAVHQQVAPA